MGLGCAEVIVGVSESVSETCDCCQPAKPKSCCCKMAPAQHSEIPAPTPAPATSQDEAVCLEPRLISLGDFTSSVPAETEITPVSFPRLSPDKLGCASASRTVLLCTFLI